MSDPDKQQIAAFLSKFPIREACLALEEGGLMFLEIGRD